MSNIFEDLEILTVTFKSEHIIESCLSKIDNNFKITIVENSNDLEFKKRMENRKNVKCILSSENIGFGCAFNLGAKSINSKYILHINPDVKIDDKIIFDLYDEAKKIKNLGILSPKEIEFGSKKNLNINNHQVVETEFVRGFVMMINNENCKPSGYFDENIFLYLEEVDLCKRLKNNNKGIYLITTLEAEHLGGKSHDPIYSEKLEYQRNWHYMWSLFYFSKKHYGIFDAYKKTFKKFLSALFKTIFYFLINKKKHNIYKHRLLGLFNSYIGKSSKFRAKI